MRVCVCVVSKVCPPTSLLGDFLINHKTTLDS